MSEHDPTPWKLSDQQVRTMGLAFIESAAGKIVLADGNAANRAFIVRAVNAHDDLLAAMRAALEASHDPVVERILMDAIKEAEEEA